MMRKKQILYVLAMMTTVQLTACSSIEFGNNDKDSGIKETTIETIDKTEGEETQQISLEETERVIREADDDSEIDKSDEYMIKLDDKELSLPIPAEWVTDVSDNLIQCAPPNYNNALNVNYSDSYARIGDMESLRMELESLESASKHEGEIQTIAVDGRDGYAICLEDAYWNVYKIYEQIPGYDNYLEIAIADFDKAETLASLVKEFAINCE